ncbi:ABC transporter ATP-binding protein, partial [Photobacterium halotolerans]|nr:ABC transporter ATP-binding protein [Photobacterium halotolerans]
KAQAEERAAENKKDESQQRQQVNREKPGKKLSYKLLKELEELPSRLEDLENEIAQLQEKINDPAFFQSSTDDTQVTLSRLTEAEQALEVAFERWEELEAMQKES